MTNNKKNIMRFILAIIAILVGGLFGKVVTHVSPVDDKDREKQIIRAVFSLMENRHFMDTKIDDAFSRKVFDTYLDRLDGGKRFLTLGDLDLLDDYQEKIDDAINEPDVEFFELSNDVINQAIGKVKIMYPKILEQPFDFTIDENIELDGEKLDFAKDDRELERRWRVFLKYETLTRLVDKLEKQDKADDPEGGKKSISELESDAREDVLEMMNEWFKRLGESRRSDRFEVYLNSATNVYDPHTDYFNPKEKEDFNINMSGRLEGIGARLSRDGEFSKVVSIVPGGPAWRQGELQVDDVIYKVTQEGSDPVDIQGMHLDDVVSMVRGKKGTVVILDVKSADGTGKTIRIERDEVKLDEGLARSAILELPGRVDKIGYIDLPRFYADFENPDGRSCAEDVALELEKLKKQNVEGVILDLRDNSGGSLNDVVQMSGLFIKEGPIVQVKGRSGNPQIYPDKDPEVRYAGPLIVMVNAYSASASEILAAALQDYGRAIIVGSSSTFGKGTVQRFYSLDRELHGVPTDGPLGDLKLTVQKFYRINGGSTQLKGVIPDIILPDRFTYIETGEKEMEYPMAWTEIAPVPFKQDIVDLTPKAQIQKKSQERLAQSPEFRLVDENAHRIKAMRDESVFPLHLEKFRSVIKSQEEEAIKYKNIFDEIDGLTIANHPQDLEYIQLDSSRIGRNDEWIKNLRKDGYLDETLWIMRDMISAGVALYEPKKD
jgi:carboxyl-terminal processing protease